MANRTNDRYREGVRTPRLVPVKASAVIESGDAIDFDSNGYAQPVDAGDKALCIAIGTATGTAADGGVSVLVDWSTDSVYEYPPDAGTVTQALIGKVCDWGGSQSIDIDASTDDVIRIIGVDTVANTLYIQLVPSYAGVV